MVPRVDRDPTGVVISLRSVVHPGTKTPSLLGGVGRLLGVGTSFVKYAICVGFLSFHYPPYGVPPPLMVSVHPRRVVISDAVVGVLVVESPDGESPVLLGVSMGLVGGSYVI
jgi:hypothetical protein